MQVCTHFMARISGKHCEDRDRTRPFYDPCSLFSAPTNSLCINSPFLYRIQLITFKLDGVLDHLKATSSTDPVDSDLGAGAWIW